VGNGGGGEGVSDGSGNDSNNGGSKDSGGDKDGNDDNNADDDNDKVDNDDDDDKNHSNHDIDDDNKDDDDKFDNDKDNNNNDDDDNNDDDGNNNNNDDEDNDNDNDNNDDDDDDDNDNDDDNNDDNNNNDDDEDDNNDEDDNEDKDDDEDDDNEEDNDNDNENEDNNAMTITKVRNDGETPMIWPHSTQQSALCWGGREERLMPDCGCCGWRQQRWCAMCSVNQGKRRTPSAHAAIVTMTMLCKCSMAMATVMAIQGRQLDNGNWTTMMGQQQCDEDGWPATCRTLASAAPFIQSNNQLKCTVLGGWDERERRFGGTETQKWVKVELIEWRLISTQSIPNQPSTHPRAANAREPIPHAS
jgi:hypothetical protein